MIGRGGLAAKLLAEEQKNAQIAAAAFSRGAVGRGALGRSAMSRSIAMSGPPRTPSTPIRQPNSGPPQLVSPGTSNQGGSQGGTPNQGGSQGGTPHQASRGGVSDLDKLAQGVDRVSG